MHLAASRAKLRRLTWCNGKEKEEDYSSVSLKVNADIRESVCPVALENRQRDANICIMMNSLLGF